MSARPPAWRTALLLLLMLGVLAATGYYGLQALTAPLPSPTPTCNSQTIGGSMAAADVTVNVYNSGSKQGLARSVKDALIAKGFPKDGTVSNKTPAVLKTTIIGGAIDAPEVVLVAGFFKDPEIKSDGRTNRTVDVIVGDTYAGFNEDAPTSVNLPTTVICAPTGASKQTPTQPATTTSTPTPTVTPTSTKTK